jgi:hypothetical protein
LLIHHITYVANYVILLYNIEGVQFEAFTAITNAVSFSQYQPRQFVTYDQFKDLVLRYNLMQLLACENFITRKNKLWGKNHVIFVDMIGME